MEYTITSRIHNLFFLKNLKQIQDVDSILIDLLNITPLPGNRGRDDKDRRKARRDQRRKPKNRKRIREKGMKFPLCSFNSLSVH